MLQWPNSGFFERAPHEAQYTSYRVALTFTSHSKKIQSFVLQTRSLRQQLLSHWTKNGDHSIVFSVQGRAGSLLGPDLENLVDNQNMEVHVGQFLLCCRCPVNWSIVVQVQDPFVTFPWHFFFSNVLELYHQRWVILRVDSLALWKIISEGDAILIPKNRGEKFSSKFLLSEFFGQGEQLCHHSVDCCFVFSP